MVYWILILRKEATRIKTFINERILLHGYKMWKFSSRIFFYLLSEYMRLYIFKQRNNATFFIKKAVLFLFPPWSTLAMQSPSHTAFFFLFLIACFGSNGLWLSFMMISFCSFSFVFVFRFQSVNLVIIHSLVQISIVQGLQPLILRWFIISQSKMVNASAFWLFTFFMELLSFSLAACLL